MELTYIILIVFLIVALIAFISYQYEQRRIAEFEKIATASGDRYHGKESKLFYDRIAGYGYRLFGLGHGRRVKHLFEVPFKDGWMSIFEYQYTTGSGKHSTTHQCHGVAIESDALPATRFSVEPERLIHQIKPNLGMTTKDIDFDMYPQFSERFFLEGEDESAVRAIFSDEVIGWFESRVSVYKVVMQYGGLLLYTRGKLRHEAIEPLKRDGQTLHDRLTLATKVDKFDVSFGDEHEWWG